MVIIPFRAADVPAEVKGAITKFHFDKGDLVKKDQPVVEISKERYSIMLQMAKSKLDGSQAVPEFGRADSPVQKRRVFKELWNSPEAAGSPG